MPESNQVLKPATPEAMLALISGAERRLVVLAPALSLRVAKAIVERWRTLGAGNVAITVDADPEVYRLGYGEIQALELLETTGADLGSTLQQHPGLRIGVIIADDALMVYSPVPQLIEAGPRHDGAPNALLLGAPPAALESAVGFGNTGVVRQEIGLDKATRAEIEAVKEDLRQNPPQRFDVARQLRVFNAAFQFVELKMTGTNISRRTVNLPSHLLGVQDDATRNQLRTLLNIVPPTHELAGRALQEQRRRLEKRYLKVIPGFGYVVLHKDKEAFLTDLEALKSAVEGFKARVKSKLTAELNERISELTKGLRPGLLASPPKDWLVPSDPEAAAQEISRCLEEDLRWAIGSADQYVSDMTVSVIFKGVTYESLTDPTFLAAAKKALPGITQLHAVFDVAKGAGKPSRPTP